jgi:ATP-binding cassette subfamily B protein
MKNLRLLLKFIKGNRLIYAAAVLAICLSVVFSTAVPVVVRFAIDSVIGGKPASLPEWIGGNRYISGIVEEGSLYRNLGIICILIVLLTAGHGLFLFLKGKLSAVASENSGKRIREHIYNHLQHLPYDYHVKTQAGDLIQRFTSDVETIQNFVSGQLVEIGQIVLSFTYLLIMMISLDAKYTLVSVVLVPVILVFTFRFFVNMKKIFKLTDEAEGRMSSTLQENLTGMRVVKAFAAQNFEMEKFDEKNSEYRDLISRIIRLMSNFWSASDLLCLLQYGLVLVTGIYWSVTGVITLGTLVAFATYSGMLIWPVRYLGQIMAFMGQAFVSLNRIQEVLDQEVEPSSPSDLKPEIKGEIEFDGVCFGYEEGKPILDRVSFRIKRGQTAAILGLTGSGKSSLVHLLLRLYDYTEGLIKIDGIELKNIDKKWLRSKIGIVLQEPFLFSKSVRDNIRFGRMDARENEILEVTSIASIHSTILSFEKGYDTVIGERGATLSGGQRQRLAIARTIIRNSPVLIFDDSLSAVDVETDAAIRRALKEKSRDATTIIISHRITTLCEADIIFVLDNGKITQSGTHEELIGEDGLYRRIWMIQNSLEEEVGQHVCI